MFIFIISLLISFTLLGFYYKYNSDKKNESILDDEEYYEPVPKKFVGLLIGPLYGIFFRFYAGFGTSIKELEFSSVLDYTFLLVIPVIIGITPIVFADKEDFSSTRSQFLFPIASICLFLLFAIVTRIEDIICLLIIGTPYLLVAGVIGILAKRIRDKINKKKLYSLMLIPFLSLPIESQFDDYSENYSTESSIIINAKDSLIWDYLIEVPLIKENEYNKGLLNHLGIPRPNQSKIEVHNGEEYRVGYFSDELILFEKIRDEQYLKQVSFEIDMDKSKFRNTPTDQHFVNSNYFRFGDITYRLEKISSNQHKLILSCDYKVESKVNFYVDFWANTIISDFEERLLATLKLKIEKGN